MHRLPRENYKTLNDIIIPNKEKTTQIDHLVISNYGIFVIENKNFAGNIYGSKYDKNWTQVMCKSNLVKRKGQYGEFLGCTSYPKCKYTLEYLEFLPYFKKSWKHSDFLGNYIFTKDDKNVNIIA